MLGLEKLYLSLLAIVPITVYFIYRNLTKDFNYWKEKGIIFKQPLVFFGNYKDFLFRASVGTIYSRIYKEFPNEKFVGCFKYRQPELLLRDPELIKQVLIKDFPEFLNRSSEPESRAPDSLNTNLFSVTGERWKAMRQKFSPAFTSAKLKNMFYLILEKGEEFQRFLEVNVKDQDEHEVRELMARFTTDVIGSCAFGVKMNSMSDSNAPFRQMGKKIFETSYKRSFKEILMTFSPRIFRFLKIRVIDPDAVKFFMNTVKEIINERKENHIMRHDFIDLLLDLKERGFLQNESGEYKIEFTDIFMTAQAFIFFAAGFETSSTLMAFTLYELAKHPEIKTKVLSEIDDVLEKHNGKVSYEAINEMSFLECVLSETMRRYPALGVLTRACNSKHTFPETKLTLDKGVTVIIPVTALHFDPKYFPEPEKFIPERFSKENTPTWHPMAYLPFGEGPRNCIGSRFGKMQSKVGLVSFLTKFTVEPSLRTEDKVTFSSMSSITVPKHGIWLNVKERK